MVWSIDLDDVPADLTFFNRPFVGVLPVEHHRLVVDGVAGGLVNAADREIKILRAVSRNAHLQHDAVADLPAETPGQAVADDAPGSIVEKGLLLVGREDDLRIHPQVTLGLNGELGEEILRVLVDAAKPVGPGQVLDAGRTTDAVGVTAR